MSVDTEKKPSELIKEFMELSASEQAYFVEDNPTNTLRMIWWLIGYIKGKDNEE